MNWAKAIGFGVLIWLIMFVLIWAILGLYNQYLWLRIALAVVAGIISLILAWYLKPSSLTLALGYGLVFVIAMVVLDALITMRTNPNIFMSKSLWLGNLLVFLAPLLAVKKKSVEST